MDSKYRLLIRLLEEIEKGHRQAKRDGDMLLKQEFENILADTLLHDKYYWNMVISGLETLDEAFTKHS